MSNEIARVHAWTLWASPVGTPFQRPLTSCRVEINCGLIAASVPTLKPIICACIPQVMRSLTKSLGQSSSGGNEHGEVMGMVPIARKHCLEVGVPTESREVLFTQRL